MKELIQQHIVSLTGVKGLLPFIIITHTIEVGLAVWPKLNLTIRKLLLLAAHLLRRPVALPTLVVCLDKIVLT